LLAFSKHPFNLTRRALWKPAFSKNMLSITFRFLSLAAALLIMLATVVSACEGECISGVTNAWTGNYSVPCTAVFTQMVRFALCAV